jgi:serine protease
MRRLIVFITAAVFFAGIFSPVAQAKTVKRYKAQFIWSSQYQDGWAQDRINQPWDQLDGVPPNGALGGAGVTIYLIDTGIGLSDCNGHGSFISSLINSNEYGVSQNANIVSVKALDCSGSGTEQAVINAVNWVSANADPRHSVVNMSLGGPASLPLDAAVSALAKKMPVVVAAGNDGGNSCNQSPARVKEAITVASFNKWHLRSIFSDFGSCVDMWAPGDSVDGFDKNGDHIKLSGTSFSTAFVTASIAYISQRDGSTTTQAYKQLACESSNLPIVDAYNGSKRPFVLWLKEKKTKATRSDCPFLLP